MAAKKSSGNAWLMKSEPDVFSIDQLARVQQEPWSGVRNYLARNYMRDQMQKGDAVLFYHSSCEIPGIAGLASVASAAYPDPTQFDSESDYFDPKATTDKPRWQLVDVKFERKFKHVITLDAMRALPALQEMQLLQRGNRLSILPITASQFTTILKLDESYSNQPKSKQKR